MPLMHGFANFLRGSVRCMFPVASLLVWTALLLVPQGTDVLRASLERVEHLHSVSDLFFLWAASGVLGLSVWYSMRWLIISELPALRFTLPLSSFWRAWMPRVSGGLAPGLVAIVLVWPGNFTTVSPVVWGTTSLAFAVLAFGLPTLFFYRASIWGSLVAAPGRDANGQPGFLPIRQRMPPDSVALIAWTLVLTTLLGVVFVLFPITGPRVVGAAAVGAMALASINLFGSFVLTWLPMRNALPPLGPWLILWAILISPLADNHVGSVSKKSLVAEGHGLSRDVAFEAWYAGVDKDDTDPIYIVAAEGGGIRAAYWTAAVLEELDRRIDKFHDHVFALSGVSGGSVGVAMWAARLRSEICAPSPSEASDASEASPQATEMLGADFVAPALAGLFYYDLVQRFLPVPIDGFDRSRGLEEGMQRAGYRLRGRPMEMTLDEFYKGCKHLPELLLNATVAETGQRALLTRLDTRSFVDVFDLHRDRLATSWQTLAQLAHHSARFPLISPPGSIRALPSGDSGLLERARELWSPNVHLRLVDGGYFDNSGLQTAAELRERIQSKVGKRDIKLVIITSDKEVAALCASSSCVDTGQLPEAESSSLVASRWMPESTSVLRALYKVRDSRLQISAARARDDFGRHVIMLLMPVPKEDDSPKAPLGWALSEGIRACLDEEVRGVVEPFANKPATQAKCPAAGCKCEKKP